MTYGVEYNQATIDAELNSFNPPATPAYLNCPAWRHCRSARHARHRHRSRQRTWPRRDIHGAAPAADIIFVAWPDLANSGLFADTANMADAFAYIFARAAQLGRPCVINMSTSDNQGPHDGTSLGEQFLDNLLLTPGRAITLSAGNSNNSAAHAAGNVPAGGTANLVLNYARRTERRDSRRS